MKYFDLTQDENKLLQSFEKGIFQSVDNLRGAKKQYQSYAKNTLGKTKNINLRLSEKVVQKLKAKAAAFGIPYQTLISSIIHRYTGA